eukprot:CAMPEP_0113551408 /NCGR_PEP_ID=MMETSP0015_2-20120614/14509_1 /TAXON_ID=2838 /ORGANISM="Odontella" /LENGTH=390 /DNA_ID=CAMNT_0000452299 /DNA_START=41 /DNA_END=1213 /DNA_ORIENTATION=- /assembly_acc=CAM_ASM_000160
MNETSSDAIPIHVGTAFGDNESPTRAVLRLTLSRKDNKLSISGPPVVIREGENPGWLSRYVTDEQGNSQRVYIALEDDPGLLQAYTVETDGDLTPLGEAVSSAGRHPCYATLDATSMWLFSSCYTEGSVAVVPVQPDGTLGPPTDSKHHQGGDLIDDSLHDRQEGPHAHCIVPHPSNEWVVSCDLGLSTVFVYGFDARRGSLVGAADDPRHLRLPKDAGPRHCVWDEKGETLFVNNELTCTVTASAFDAGSGRLKEICTVPVLPKGVDPDRNHHRGGSDIAIHPNGKFLYVGCRSSSPGTIAIICITGSGEGSNLDVIGHESTRGEVPRNFKLIGEKDCDKWWLVVGNQESKTVVSYVVDSNTGSLKFSGEVSTAPYKPCNIASMSALYA